MLSRLHPFAVESRDKVIARAVTDGLRWREEVNASRAITTAQPRHILGETHGVTVML